MNNPKYLNFSDNELTQLITYLRNTYGDATEALHELFYRQHCC